MLYKIVKYVQLFSLVLWFICFFHASILIQLRHLQFHFICLPLYRCFVTHDYLYTNTSFFFRFSVFSVLRFSVSVFRFSVSVNAYAHALCSCSSSFKNETSTSFSSSSFHFTFFCFFFRLLSISWLVVHVVFFRLSFIHIQKKNETNSCQFQFIRVINTPSITSTSQRHLYFLQSRIPLFYESTKKKKINKKNKNDRHLVSKTSFNLLVIHVEILRSITTCAENVYHFTPENTFTLRHTMTPHFTKPLLQHLHIL